MAKLVWHNFPNLKFSLGKLVFAGWLSLSLLDETAEAKNSRAGNVNLRPADRNVFGLVCPGVHALPNS